MAERLTRTAVVERAADLSDEIGLGEVTITRVGQAVGIAPPGVYRHVVDVVDLRGAIADLAATEVARELARASAGLAGRAALAALADRLRAWAHEHPGRYAALQVAPDPDDEAGLARAGTLLEVFGAALRAYDLTGDAFTDGVRLVRSAIHGFVDLEQHGGFKQPRSRDETFERIIDALDTVLCAWGGEQGRE
ncbi:TetR-like C-terminal domain-containing protein [Brooklawnia cerclae]|uniref:AcrR family transcriptional regulator n=1 Tax=Brooklawnia cerclae TaxID=349934 RepID=A0ABX0SIN9_9ACTN|nr:TetR-like C-terminal domain-containing protein [Brooklawnia cerclae]NIH57841.1 AcrR family transcriptional regulator [Brooklawnia cerclae]